jgi:membrane-associated phospholipid phosphatase
MLILANVISISFGGTLVACVCMYLYRGEVWWIWLFGGLLLINVFVIGLKHLFGREAPFSRPKGASGCDAFCMKGSASGDPGFPSGHMTTSSMFITALWLRYHNPLILWFGIPWLIAMGWARWVKRCHNIEQIVAGTITGSSAAAVLVSLIK